MKSRFAKKLVSAGVALAVSSIALPVGALAQTPADLVLSASGTVELWNSKTSNWDPFTGGVARQGQTYRCIEGGHLEGHITGAESIKLSSCSAIRFVRLSLSEGGNIMYAKGFGQIETTMPQTRVSRDDIRIEYPVGLQILGRDAAGSGTVAYHTTYQTPTARNVRLGVHEGNSKLQGLSHISGIVESVSPGSGTFTIKEDITGRLDTVVLKGFSQLAKPTLAARVLNESPAQIANSLQVGEKVTVYGIATAGATGSVPAPGSGAFAQETPINFIPTVVYPLDGQFIYGGVFVLSSPITPPVGDGVLATGAGTLTLTAGDVLANLLPGVQLVNVACEIGNEAFVVLPPTAPVVVGAGAGNLPLYVLLGVGAAVLLENHGTTTNVVLPPATTVAP